MSYNPKICVYAIAKDEEANASRWMEVLRGADAVVVLDTGSSDRTAEILRGRGATVVAKKYDNFRFDVARNDALQYALETDADVFLALDMDEFPDPGWDEAIRSDWDPSVHTRGCYDLYLGAPPIACSRNWIHDRSWRWRFPVHECMERRDGSGTLYHVRNQLDLRGKFFLDILVRRHRKHACACNGHYHKVFKFSHRVHDLILRRCEAG